MCLAYVSSWASATGGRVAARARGSALRTGALPRREARLQSRRADAARGGVVRPAVTSRRWTAMNAAQSAVAAPETLGAPADVEVGAKLHGFELTRAERVSEVGCEARMWRHEKTGTELLSVCTPDENKVFSVVLRTPPSDSTGVPHILEHSVLCGSRKYPVKEPFVELIKASLNTFLNAMTYPDKTCYPVASCNTRDFYNLVDVYLDAVFFPLLTPDTLAQEGHHIELEKKDDPLTFKGVVYNEMKGAFSDPERVLASLSQQVLFPDITYGVESGGDPRVIPDLGWEQFKTFHEKFYHPSNARLFFYGDDDEVKRLEKANEYLSLFEPREDAAKSSMIDLQKPFSEPRVASFPYDAGKDGLERKYMATLNWMLLEGSKTDAEKLVALAVLDHILTNNSGAPLHKALIDSGLGEEVIGGGLETDLRQMMYSIGLKGMDKDGAQKMEEVVFDVLRKHAKEGFSKETIEASINTIEFQLRENNTGRFPRGLSLMLRSMTSWLHDADPLRPLRYEQPLTAVKNRLAAGEKVFEPLIEELFISNSHRARVELTPDAEAAEREEKREKERLLAVREKLTDKDLENLIAETQRLKAKQAAHDAPEDLAKIPTLTKADLEPKVATVPYELEKVGSGSIATLMHHPQITNGVVYVDLMLDATRVSPAQLPYLSLLGSFMTELGTTKQDFVELQQRIGRETGGVRVGVSLSQMVAADGNGPALGRMLMRGKSMVAQVPALLDVMRELLMEVNLDDKERFKQLLTEERAGTESSVVPSGHVYASSRIRAQYRVADWASEKMSGYEYLTFLRELSARIDTEWESISAELKAARNAVVQQNALVLNVTTSAGDFSAVKPNLVSFIDSLPEFAEAPSELWTDHLVAEPGSAKQSEALIIPAQINYVGKGGNLADIGFKATGGSYLASKHLGTSYLWDTVRVQGGAYGGFCRLDMRSGAFSFLSYRDPNIDYTLKAFDGAAKFLRDVKMDDKELEKSIIGAIGDMDSYQLPDAKGFASASRILSGETDELRQQRREEILGASKKDFVELGDALEAVKESSAVVIVGSAEAITKAEGEGVELKNKISLF